VYLLDADHLNQQTLFSKHDDRSDNCFVLADYLAQYQVKLELWKL